MLQSQLRNLLSLTILALFSSALTAKIKLVTGDDIAFVGAGMGSRMIHYGHFETEIYLRHAQMNLKIRNLCDEGNTPGFRPHPSRNQEEQYAFPGAKELIHESLRGITNPKAISFSRSVVIESSCRGSPLCFLDSIHPLMVLVRLSGSKMNSMRILNI